MIYRRAQSTARWILIACLVTGVLVAAGLGISYLLRSSVTVTEAVEGPVVQAFYSTGTVQPEREYPIKSNIAGVLTELKVDKGDRVSKADVLAVVSEPELKFKYEQASAQLVERQKRADAESSPVLQEFTARIAATEDLLEIARREQERMLGLVQRNAASQTDLDRAIDRFKTLWSESESLKAQMATITLELQKDLQVAQAALEIAQWNLDQQTLKAPIESVVLDRPISLGTRVAVNDQIMRIADVRPENLVMRAAVDEEDIAKVRLDQLVRMTLYSFPGRVFDGRVTQIYDQADEQRRTFEVDVRLSEKNKKLSPGMTGELAFIMDERAKAIVVPSQAVQQGSVWGVENGRLKRLNVELGLQSIERAEVRSGIQPGQRVIISPVGDLPEGKRVRTTYIDPITAAGINKPAVVQDSFKGFN